MDCLFCKIVSGEIPSKILHENEHVVAFYDISPIAPVHVLIVPRAHIKSLNEIDASNAQIIAHVHLAAKEISEKLGISQSGYRVINNCGDDAGQSVHHIHFHLIGGKKMQWGC